MFDLTVKTLDGRDHTFSIEENTPVSQLKQQITNTLNIPTEEQRLIFRGRMLTDDTMLKGEEMSNKVLHLVTRPPPPYPANSQEESPANAVAETDVYLGDISTLVTPERIQEILRDIFETTGITIDDSQINVSERDNGIEIQVDLTNQSQQLTNHDNPPNRDIVSRLNNVRQILSQLNVQLEVIERNFNSESVDIFGSVPAGKIQDQILIFVVTSESSRTIDERSPVLEQFSSFLNQFQNAARRVNILLERFTNTVNQLVNDRQRNLSNLEQLIMTHATALMHYMSHIYHNLSDLALIIPTENINNDLQESVRVAPNHISNVWINNQNVLGTQQPMDVIQQFFTTQINDALHRFRPNRMRGPSTAVLSTRFVHPRFQTSERQQTPLVYNHQVVTHVINDDNSTRPTAAHQAPRPVFFPPQMHSNHIPMNIMPRFMDGSDPSLMNPGYPFYYYNFPYYPMVAPQFVSQYIPYHTPVMAYRPVTPHQMFNNERSFRRARSDQTIRPQQIDPYLPCSTGFTQPPPTTQSLNSDLTSSHNSNAQT